MQGNPEKNDKFFQKAGKPTGQGPQQDVDWIFRLRTDIQQCVR